MKTGHKTRHARLLKSALASAVLLSGATSAQAADEGLSIQRFQPAPGGTLNYNHVEGASVLRSLQPAFGLTFNYAYLPLTLRSVGSDTTQTLLTSDLAVDVTAALGILDWLQLGVAVPYTLSQAQPDVSSLGLTPVASSALGDIRAAIRLRMLATDRLLLSLSLPMSLDTGSEADLHGELGMTFEPRLLAEARLDGLRLGGQVGYKVRPAGSYLQLDYSSEVTFGFGGELGVVEDHLALVGELFGTLAPGSTNGDGQGLATLEANLGGRYLLAGGHSLNVGIGPGLVRGYGTPLLRAFLGYSFTPKRAEKPRDTDNDGLVDSADACPKEPEDIDQYEDTNGCPDPDNDADGLLDTSDRCALVPEDKDGFQDEDGCPDLDNDDDGVADADDRCPTEQEDRDSFNDDDGCRDPDNDGDGLLDAQDSCPLKAEDKDTLGDEDGCPETDFDQDGVLDELDQCPRKAENLNRFKDEDGCPEPDEDQDAIVDEIDKCPKKPETVNGIKDEDGCPDESKGVEMKGSKLELLNKVYFATDKTEILPKSFPVLRQVIAVLKANPQITKVTIDGHTDSQGEDAYNLQLSQGRVDAVMKFLVEGGIEATRLSATGFGETKPIATNDTDAGRAKNRRVEFNVVEINGQPVEPSTTVPPSSVTVPPASGSEPPKP